MRYFAPINCLVVLVISLSGCGGGPTLEPDCGAGQRLCGNKGLYDYDGDGYCEDVDCDENSCDIHPDAPERCNGFDDDCNGQADGADPGLVVVDDAKEYYVDYDKDRFCGSHTQLICDAAFDSTHRLTSGLVDSEGKPFELCRDGDNLFTADEWDAVVESQPNLGYETDCCDYDGDEDACPGDVPPKCVYPQSSSSDECGVDPDCDY